MEEKSPKFTYDLTRVYLEVARGAMMPLHHAPRKQLIAAHGPNPLINAELSLVSITIIYSYLAIESFVNWQLFELWRRRHDGSATSETFLDVLGDSGRFKDLRAHKRFAELGERIKALCGILKYPKIHEANPPLWENFKRLAETSRHFLVHPTPDQTRFQENMERIMGETQAGVYTRVAEGILRFLYEQSKKTEPPWLAKNTLIAFRGAELLVGRELCGDKLSNIRMQPTAGAGLLSRLWAWIRARRA